MKKDWETSYTSGHDFMPLNTQSLKRLVDSIPRFCSDHCLDIACGTGQIGREFSHYNFWVDGIDSSESAIKIASQATASHRLKYICADFMDYDFKDTIYGAAICKFAFPFFEDKRAFLQKVYKLLGHTGVLLIITPLPSDVEENKKHIATDREEILQYSQGIFDIVDEFRIQNVTCFVLKALYTENPLRYRRPPVAYLKLGRSLWEQVTESSLSDYDATEALSSITHDLTYSIEDGGFMRQLSLWIDARRDTNEPNQDLGDKIKIDFPEFFES